MDPSYSEESGEEPLTTDDLRQSGVTEVDATGEEHGDSDHRSENVSHSTDANCHSSGSLLDTCRRYQQQRHATDVMEDGDDLASGKTEGMPYSPEVVLLKQSKDVATARSGGSERVTPLTELEESDQPVADKSNTGSNAATEHEGRESSSTGDHQTNRRVAQQCTHACDEASSLHGFESDGSGMLSKWEKQPCGSVNATVTSKCDSPLNKKSRRNGKIIADDYCSSNNKTECYQYASELEKSCSDISVDSAALILPYGFAEDKAAVHSHDHKTKQSETPRNTVETPARTSLHWSVSLDGPIPHPPSSLQVGRNFSAPGAFRMYQTGTLEDEPESSDFHELPPLTSDSIAEQVTFTQVESQTNATASTSAVSSENYVVEAELVRYQSQPEGQTRRNDVAIGLVEAKPLHEAGYSRAKKLLLVPTLVVTVAIALSIGVWLGQDNSVLRPKESPAPNSEPLPPLRDQFDALLPEYTVASLHVENSPQSKAYSWVLSRSGMANVTTVERLLTRFALASLYYATRGEKWKDSAGWLTGAHECEWFISDFQTACPDEKTVREIALLGNGLSGTLPAELELLRELKTIILSENSITGTLPAQLGRLSHLETLMLYSNRLQDLSGTLSILKVLKKLRVFDIENNLYEGDLPAADLLEEMPALTAMYIGVNSLRGSIPSEYASLSSLESLSLENLRLTGSIPTSFVAMSNIDSLYLFGNRLTGSISDDLLDLWKSRLWHLDLAQNRFSGTISTKFGLLTRLSDLYLSGNNFTGTIPTEVGLLTQLSEFDFYKNRFIGTIPTEIGLLTNLKKIYLDGNMLTGSIPTELGGLTNLWIVYLNNNQLSGSVPKELCKLKRKKRDFGFELNVNCELVACDCGCTCVVDTSSNQRRRLSSLQNVSGAPF